MTTDETSELTKLRRTVEMTERVRDGLRDNLLQRFVHSVSLFEPREWSASERYMLELSERHLDDAKARYREAQLRFK